MKAAPVNCEPSSVSPPCHGARSKADSGNPLNAVFMSSQPKMPRGPQLSSVVTLGRTLTLPGLALA